MRRLLTWSGVVIACMLPVVTLSAAMVWLLPPPVQVLGMATRVFDRTARAISPPPGPALERRRHSKNKSARKEVLHGSVTVRATPTADRSLLMEVYPARDASAGTPRRAIVIIHGQDWPAVDSGGGAQASAWLASQGFHVFDVQAQLGADGLPGDAALNVKCAVGWIKRHAGARLAHFGVNVDPRRVALLGRRQAGPLAVASAISAGGAAEICAGGDASVDAAISFYGPPHARLERAPQGAPALLIIRGQDGPGDRLYGIPTRGKAAPQGVFLRDLSIPVSRPGFDMVFGARGESRAEDAVVRFLTDVDDHTRG